MHLYGFSRSLKQFIYKRKCISLFKCIILLTVSPEFLDLANSNEKSPSWWITDRSPRQVPPVLYGSRRFVMVFTWACSSSLSWARIIQFGLSGILSIQCRRFSGISENIAVAIFSDNISGERGWNLLYRYEKVRSVGGDWTKQRSGILFSTERPRG
jgi:hypothetical protein